MKESFGTRLQRLRKERKLTQEEVAEKLNVSFQAVSKWENDLTSPDLDTLVILGEMFNVSLDELLGREVKTQVVPEELRKDPKKLLLRIDCFSSEGEKALIKIPVALLEIFVNNNESVPIAVSNNEAVKNIDFKKILELVNEGLMGELMTLSDADGSEVKIYIE